MSRSSVFLPRTSIAIGTLAGIGVAIAMMFVYGGHAASGSSASIQPDNDASRANGIWTFTSQEYLNPVTFNPEQASNRPDTTITKRTVKLGADGQFLAMEAITQDVSGTLQQIDVNVGGREYVQSGTGSCVDSFIVERGGSGLPQASPASLENQGFKLAEPDPSEMEQIGQGSTEDLVVYERTKANLRAGYETMKIREVLDSRTHDIRAEFIYLLSRDGGSVLDQSRINSPIEVTDPDISFAPPVGPSCVSSEQPSTNGTD
jgi:hypothetical protein